MPTWKFSGPPAPVRMMAGRATEPSSALPARLNCCCTTVDLKWEEIPGKAMPAVLAPGSVGVAALPPRCAASWAGAHSPLNLCLAAALLLEDLLLWRHGVFQHGGLLITLQSKVVFALFLQRERENYTLPSSCSPDTIPGSQGPPALLQLSQQYRVPMAARRQMEGTLYTPLERGYQCPSQHRLTFLRMISM